MSIYGLLIATVEVLFVQKYNSILNIKILLSISIKVLFNKMF